MELFGNAIKEVVWISKKRVPFDTKRTSKILKELVMEEINILADEDVWFVVFAQMAYTYIFQKETKTYNWQRKQRQKIKAEWTRFS